MSDYLESKKQHDWSDSSPFN